MIRWHVISAVFGRNVKQYFTSVSGYLFIVAFVTVCAVLAFSQQFFIDNLANLDQLSRFFPLLLLFLVPAITMGVWADERRQGTDAILFTLPASDLEILLGKYFSVVAVYTIALAFSVTQLIALANIGEPDWGVTFSTYLGYWLSGCALLSVGMVASSLTRSNTVAFILGALFCAVPVLGGRYFHGSVGMEQLGFEWHLRDFCIGLVSLTSILYFVSLTVLMLYINLVVITRRHWSRGQTVPMGIQFVLRTIGLAAALISANHLVGQAALAGSARLDWTRDSLYTLDAATRATLEKAATAGRAITIQAYVSNEIPRQYVHVKNHFVGLLEQLERVGGENLDLKLNYVEPYSAAANEARTLGVTPTNTTSELAGRTVQQDVFLGAYVISDFGDAVIPRIDAESSIEYELVRAIASTTDKQKKLRVGVLDTVLFFIGPVFQNERLRWSFDNAYKRLAKNYELEPVTAQNLQLFAMAANASGEQASSLAQALSMPDVLLVADASSLPKSALNHLVAYIRSGRPVLIMLDPLPFYWTFIAPDEFGIINAPRQPRVGRTSRYRPMLTSYFEEKGFSGDPGQSEILAEAEVQVTFANDLPATTPAELYSVDTTGTEQLVGTIPPGDIVQHKAKPGQLWRFKSVNRRTGRSETVGWYQATNEPAQLIELSRHEMGGTALSLLTELGIVWNNGRVAWHEIEPPRGFTPQKPQYLGESWPIYYGPQQNCLTFVHPQGVYQPFNRQALISQGLRRMLFVYPGSIAAQPGATTQFTPLIQLATNSGQTDWHDLTFVAGDPNDPRQALFSPITGSEMVVVQPQPESRRGSEPLTIAAQITGVVQPAHAPVAKGETPANSPDPRTLNVVVVADTDFLSDIIEYQQDSLELPLDNVKFIENTIELLAGDPELVRLRNRNAQPATLTRFEALIEEFRTARVKQQQEKEAEILDKLEASRKKLQETAKAIEDNPNLDRVGQRQLLQQEQTIAQRNFDVERERLERELNQVVSRIKGDEQLNVSRVETRVRLASVLLAPLPAVLLGISVLLVRFQKEKSEIRPGRRI